MSLDYCLIDYCSRFDLIRLLENTDGKPIYLRISWFPTQSTKAGANLIALPFTSSKRLLFIELYSLFILDTETNVKKKSIPLPL